MVDLYRKNCIICEKYRPSFNLPDEKKATHCFTCKTSDMVDITHPKCVICKNKRPYFGLKEGTPTHCSDCKLPEHNNVVSKKCESCKKTVATFGLTKATHCGACKTSEMKDLKHAMCLKCEKTRPSYNYSGEKIPLYCKLCKLDDMIDVVNDMCIVCNKTQPSFNYSTEISALYCVKCKLPGMFDIHTIKCNICNITSATYGVEGDKNPSRCKTHKDSEMIDIIHTSCITRMCNTRVTDKYQGYCMRCYIYQFPEAEVSKVYRIKEKHVTDFVAKSFPEISMTLNKQIDGGCSKRRPDIFIDRLTHCVIVEIDEEQHKNYDTTCETARLNELYTDLGDRPLILIRFNPDAYIKNGKKMPSSFKAHATLGVPVVANKKEWSMRMDILTDIIEKHINNVPIEPLTMDYVFYNE
jgi:hypothetical protein